MRNALAVVAAIAVWTGGVRAAAPTLTLPATVQGTPGAFISVAADTSGTNVAWFVLDTGLNLFPVAMLKDTHTAVVSSGTPGTYRLLAVTAAGGDISTPAVCKVVVVNPTPTPTPTPGPDPGPGPPTPSPTVDKAAWAIVVVDNNARTPAIAQLIASPTLPPALHKLGVDLRVLDVNDPLVAAKNYTTFVAEAGGAPALLVLTVTGKRLKAIKLPANEPAFLKEVQP